MPYVKGTGNKGQITVEPPLTVGNQLPLTFDCVIYVPHDNDYNQQWHTLAREINGDRYGGDHFVIVEYGKKLGYYDNRKETHFRSSDFDMSTLSIGWHHFCTKRSY